MSVSVFEQIIPRDNRRLRLVESVRWEPETNQLSFVDIDEGNLLVKVGEVLTEYSIAPKLSFAQPRYDGKFLVAAGNRIGIWQPGGFPAWTRSLIPNSQRFNDGAVDHLGRLVIGTMSLSGEHRRNSLYVFEPNGQMTTVTNDVGLSNGICFHPDSGNMFHVDTAKSMISQFNLDRQTGEYHFGRVFHQFPAGSSPDGLVMTTCGHFIVAMWGQHRLAILDDKGEEVERIAVPFRFPTSVDIAGSLETLFVGYASEPREGLKTVARPGGVWKTPIHMTPAQRIEWSYGVLNLLLGNRSELRQRNS